MLHNLALDLRTRRHILMGLLQFSLEHGCEVWNTNKRQAQALYHPYNYLLVSISWDILEQLVMSLYEQIWAWNFEM